MKIMFIDQTNKRKTSVWTIGFSRFNVKFKRRVFYQAINGKLAFGVEVTRFGRIKSVILREQ